MKWRLMPPDRVTSRYEPGSSPSGADRGTGPRVNTRPVVAVQGLGFVGTAMALASASAREPDGIPAYDVIGVELDTPAGRQRADALNAGRLPISSTDPKLEAALRDALDAGNLRATDFRGRIRSRAAVAIVDISLDVSNAG